MSQNRSRSQLDESLDAQIWQAMVSLGWVQPLDDATQERIEAEFEQAIASEDFRLPKTLESPDAIFAKLQSRKEAATSFDAAIQEQMARAAREGGAIPPDVEEKMRRDRKEAEAKHQKSKGYEDLFG